MDQEVRKCKNCREDFTVEPDDFSFYNRVGVPEPTFCPDCRRQRRLAWRNDYNFYNRECGLCGRKIISIYSPEKPVPIYCNKCWWGDSWDPKQYGRDYDPSRPFFEQYRELLDAVPALAILNDNNIASVGCEYTNYFALGKNSYLTINSWKVENCLYSYYLVDTKDAVDVMTVFSNGRNLYESISVEESNSCKYAVDSRSLIDCAFCYDCKDCSNCFMSIGLRHKKYCFKNQQYSKGEYEKILKKYRLDTWSGSEQAKKEFLDFILKFPRRPANFMNCVNCTGNYLVNSKNAVDCWNAVRVEDSKFFENGDTIKDSYDCASGGEQELCYEGINPDNSYNTHFTSYCHKDRDVWYSDSCQSSEELFGCVGLKSAKYCILNKQYAKEEYEKLKAEIVEGMKKRGEWGEFFPASLSTFGYNETLAEDNYPLAKEEALAKGYRWQDELQFTTGKETMRKIPDAIGDVPDSITNEILACAECNRNYKILAEELAFYQRNGIPVPWKCFFCRLKDRLKLKNPVKLWHRQCMCGSTDSPQATTDHGHSGKCPNEFETSYAPDRPEIVYCEECYQKEVV